MTTPYYSDDHVTLYHGDCRELVHSLSFDVVVADPPYGIGWDAANAKRGRSRLAEASDFPDIHGDDEPFDPAPWLALARPMVLFGANHYADRLPPASRWLIWDKLDGLTTTKRDVGFCDQADAELAWTNLGGPARLYSQRWLGMLKAGRDASIKRRHPTEKPVELMTWVLVQVPDGVVLDPYMGSGTTPRAAKDLGRRAIGIEIDERYCEIAARRCAQEVLAL